MLVEFTEKRRKFACRAEDVALVTPLDDGGCMVQLAYGDPPQQRRVDQTFNDVVERVNDALCGYEYEEA